MAAGQAKRNVAIAVTGLCCLAGVLVISTPQVLANGPPPGYMKSSGLTCDSRNESRRCTSQTVAGRDGGLLAPLVASPPPQEVVTIRGDETTCATCRIVLDQNGIITDEDNPGWLSETLMVSQDASGGLYAVSWPLGMSQIVKFSSDTRRTEYVLGRRGAGPGEFSRILPPLFSANGTMYVFDIELSRLSPFSPDQELLSTVPLRARGLRWLVLPDGRFIVAAVMPTREHVGQPLHMFDAAGSHLSSFGAAPDVLYRADRTGVLDRAIARSGFGGVWAAHLYRYRIELYDGDGRLQRIVERVVDWFEPWDGDARAAQVTRPRPAILAVWEDSSQRLWVLVQVADSNWRRTVFSEGDRAMLGMAVAERSMYYDMMIEVIDPIAGRLIVQQRFDEHIMTLGDRHPLITFQQDEHGNVAHTVLTARIQEGASQ
jgi:hypothetical protein